MKLVVAVVQGEDAERAERRGPRLDAGGEHRGFLRQGNVTLLIGVTDLQVADALTGIRQNCHERGRYLTAVPPLAGPGEFLMTNPVEVQVDGATVFVVPVDSLEKI